MQTVKPEELRSADIVRVTDGPETIYIATVVILRAATT